MHNTLLSCYHQCPARTMLPLLKLRLLSIGTAGAAENVADEEPPVKYRPKNGYSFQVLSGSEVRQLGVQEQLYGFLDSIPMAGREANEHDYLRKTAQDAIEHADQCFLSLARDGHDWSILGACIVTAVRRADSKTYTVSLIATRPDCRGVGMAGAVWWFLLAARRIPRPVTFVIDAPYCMNNPAAVQFWTKHRFRQEAGARADSRLRMVLTLPEYELGRFSYGVGAS